MSKMAFLPLRSRALRVASLSLALLLSGTAIALAAGPSQLASAAADKALVDPLNGLAAPIAAGWTWHQPDPRALAGIASWLNYSTQAGDEVRRNGLPIPDAWARIDALTERLGDGQTLESWIVRQQGLSRADAAAPEALAVSESVPVRLGALSGLAYAASSPGFGSSLNLALGWVDGKVLSVAILPATSTSLKEALELVATLQPYPERPGFAPTPGLPTTELLRTLQPLINAVASNAITATCPGPAGTFDLGEAPNSPIALQMPFPSGTAWEVGNIGSYFGNGQHCNDINDYYATDWNRRNAGCAGGYVEDFGTATRPVAAGSVVESFCSTAIGYGCRIQVQHSSAENGIQTRYAHLKDLFVASGAVNAWTDIGTVGCSGLSACGPHLHLSFTQKISGTYYSRCNGPAANATCPNGLAKAWPQTAKPSPMATSGGSVNLADGGCYVSANQQGGGGGWEQLIDDSSASCTLGGPAQYWTQVTGLGTNNQMRYTWNAQTSGSNWVYWNFNVPTTANYLVQVYIPSNHATTTSARYYVHNGTAWQGPYIVNQNNFFNQWVTLTTINLPAGARTLYLGDVTGEATGTKKVGVDAARMIRQ